MALIIVVVISPTWKTTYSWHRRLENQYHAVSLSKPSCSKNGRKSRNFVKLFAKNCCYRNCVHANLWPRKEHIYICVYCFHDKGRTAWNLFIKVAKFRLSINELKLRDTYIWRWDGYWVCDSSFWHNECWLLSLLLLLLFQNHRCTCVRYVRTYWQIIEEILSNKQN